MVDFIPISLYFIPLHTRPYPFHLFISNKESKKISLYLKANTLWSEEAIQEFFDNEDFISIYISKEQKQIFEHFTGITLCDDIDLIYKKEEKILIDDFRVKIHDDDFSDLIKRSYSVINNFPTHISSSVSLAKEFSKRYLIEDNTTNRIVALSTLLALTGHIYDPNQLSYLINAAFFHHIGLTGLPLELTSKIQNHFTKQEAKIYREHPTFSVFLLKKSGLPFHAETYRIIEEHHELVDGSGYPIGKKEKQIHPMSQILSLASNTIEYSCGLINGNILSVEKTLKQVKNKIRPKGLNVEFSPIIDRQLKKIVI